MSNHLAGLTLMFVHRGFVTETDTETDKDRLNTVLDHRHGYSNDFDSAEFALFNHSQRISVVTKD